MKRKAKRGSGIYNFLESSGLLVHGTGVEIEQAKKLYWESKRKEAKKQKRQVYKSYAVFLDPKEQQMIRNKARKQQTSITGFIKMAAIAHCNNQMVTDKIAFGEIRELFALHFNTIQLLQEEQQVPEEIGEKLLQQLEQLETTTLTFLQNL